tara:strand:- start:1699 stop:1977 length:279 start_codon:yes stop_codon:yes gene_type:complete
MPTQEEQLIVAGDEAEVLLQNSAFNSVINELVERAFQTFVNTGPEDVEKREYSYNHYRAIVDVVDTLKQRVQVSQSITEQQNGDNSQEEPAP